MRHERKEGLFKYLWEEGYFWLGIHKDCNFAAKNCNSCQKYNVERSGFHPLQPINAELPFDHVCIDLIGLLETSEARFNYVLVIVDIATRFVILRALKDKTTEEVA